MNRVVGLEIGGDDYVVKPFSVRELMARIKAVRRRNAPPSVSGAVLTRQEFRLVELLARHPGRVFTRDQVLDQAWGDGGFVTDRTIDAHIKTIRKKFAGVEFIETVRGIGYRAREWRES